LANDRHANLLGPASGLPLIGPGSLAVQTSINTPNYDSHGDIISPKSRRNKAFPPVLFRKIHQGDTKDMEILPFSFRSVLVFHFKKTLLFTGEVVKKWGLVPSRIK
jgi:hypothetical protein